DTKGGIIIPKVEFKEFAEFPKKKGESKCVFFLGAGFSADAGIPTQKHLLPAYLKSGGEELILNFLSDIYSFDYPPNADRVIYPKLEEIFSTIDTAIMNNEYLKKYPPYKLEDFEKPPKTPEYNPQVYRGLNGKMGKSKYSLEEVRKKLVFDILKLIDTSKVKSDYIDNFAKVLTDYRLNSGNNDPFAIITTNWDIVLLNAFRRYHNEIIKSLCYSSKIKNLNGIKDINDREKIALLDYCLYTHPLYDKENHIPSLKIKAMGYKNVKLLYLHGSPTWLYCRRCRRIYSDPSYSRQFDKKALNYECKDCPQCYTTSHNTLSHVLTMPTYYKIIQNVHLLDVWQNAAMELQEATGIFFIGYGLREADYLIRNLLVSNLNKGADIYISSIEEKFEDSEAVKNYRQIFGNRIKEDNYKGGKARSVVGTICKEIENKNFKCFSVL
ncbi:MAG: hypothetical protein KAT65_01505, partial [Methanophagales archaeon]|nr:hypothetical protein [Methanophagales archaeon]